MMKVIRNKMESARKRKESRPTASAIIIQRNVRRTKTLKGRRIIDANSVKNEEIQNKL